jgi:hypothetical protein
MIPHPEADCDPDPDTEPDHEASSLLLPERNG